VASSKALIAAVQERIARYGRLAAAEGSGLNRSDGAGVAEFSNEALAQRMDRAAERVSFAGLSGLNALIEKLIFEKQQNTGISYNDALFAVAKEQPQLFLTKARLELGRINYDEAIYFRWVNGQLVNPAVMMEGGGFRALDSPLDIRVLPGANLEQEIALRVAAKMQQLVASAKGPLSYGDAMRLVGRECPELTRLWQRSTTGRGDQ
jgi:hypothetical protein